MDSRLLRMVEPMPYPLKNPSRRLDHALKELAQLLVNNRTRPEGMHLKF
jgi:hypothetical protein